MAFFKQYVKIIVFLLIMYSSDAANSVRDALNDELGIFFDTSLSFESIQGPIKTSLGETSLRESKDKSLFEQGENDSIKIAREILVLGRNAQSITLEGHILKARNEVSSDEETGLMDPAPSRGRREINSLGDLSWYDLNYKYDVMFGEKGSHFNIKPVLSVALWGLKVEREILEKGNGKISLKPGPRVGLDIEWPNLNKFSLSGEALGSIPFNDVPQVYTFGINGKYRIFEKSGSSFLVFLGLELNHIEPSDNLFSNNQKADTIPLGVAGVTLRYGG